MQNKNPVKPMGIKTIFGIALVTLVLCGLSIRMRFQASLTQDAQTRQLESLALRATKMRTEADGAQLGASNLMDGNADAALHEIRELQQQFETMRTATASPATKAPTAAPTAPATLAATTAATAAATAAAASAAASAAGGDLVKASSGYPDRKAVVVGLAAGEGYGVHTESFVQSLRATGYDGDFVLGVTASTAADMQAFYAEHKVTLRIVTSHPCAQTDLGAVCGDIVMEGKSMEVSPNLARFQFYKDALKGYADADLVPVRG
jgi:hypothetical protein